MLNCEGRRERRERSEEKRRREIKSSLRVKRENEELEKNKK